MSSKVDEQIITEQDREIARLRAKLDGLSGPSSRIPGPTRRVALGPHTLAHSRPLEPGESVEVVNESGRTWWVRAAREFDAAHPIDDRRGRLRAEAERDAILRWAVEHSDEYHLYRHDGDEGVTGTGTPVRKGWAAALPGDSGELTWGHESPEAAIRAAAGLDAGDAAGDDGA